MNPLVKRFVAIGATSVIATTGAFLIDPWEGNENHAYKDIVGVVTICRGTTKGVKMGDYRTNEQCDKSTVKELEQYNKAMLKYVKVPLAPYEEVAYTSFVWNLGEVNFKNSTLLKKLNAGDHSGACKELLRWNKADGKEVRGLTNRRNHEYEVCEGRDAKVNAALKELEGYRKPSEAIKDKRSELPPATVETNAPSPAESVLEPLPSYEESVSVATTECKWKFFNVCLKRN